LFMYFLKSFDLLRSVIFQLCHRVIICSHFVSINEIKFLIPTGYSLNSCTNAKNRTKLGNSKNLQSIWFALYQPWR
jgi:hypothetical protein